MRREDFLSDFGKHFVCKGVTDGCPLHLVNQNKGNKKMTPNDIATDISGLKPANDGNIATMTIGTQSFVGGKLTIDDANQCG